MCTAITYHGVDFYFGRTLDLWYSHNEAVTITPRHFPFVFRKAEPLRSHTAIIGVAAESEGYPLYYEAINEAGLCMASLNFPGNAVYFSQKPGKDNIAPFELIPWILGQCQNLKEAEPLLNRLNIAHIPFSEAYPLTPLHWIIADHSGSVTVESTADGLAVFKNPVGVLTNSPSFNIQLWNLANYMALSANTPQNRMAPALHLSPYSHGMGALGLPGDLSSASRFVRAVFTKTNAAMGKTEEECISQFFHILGTVSQTRGCVMAEGAEEKTVYTSCYNGDRGICRYTTYENSAVTEVHLHRENLDGSALIRYPLIRRMRIHSQN